MCRLIYDFGFGKAICRLPMPVLNLAIRLALEKTGNISNLSKLLGVSRNVIRLWREGMHKPTKQHLEKLAEIAGIPVDTLESD